MEIILDKWDIREAIQDFVHKKLGDNVYVESFSPKEEGAIVKNPISVKLDYISVTIQK